MLPAGLPRFDLLAQINEVEARQEEYSETLAFLGLVNALLESVGPGGLPAGGVAVGHYTQLLLQYVVGNLWQRGYRYVVSGVHCSCTGAWVLGGLHRSLVLFLSVNQALHNCQVKLACNTAWATYMTTHDSYSCVWLCFAGLAQ